MELEQQVKLTDNIHEKLDELKGERVEVRANLGRSKIAIYKGEITGTYPAIFIMEAERKRGKTSHQSFQYVDILTGVVEAYYEDGKPIFGEFVIDEDEDKDAPEVMLGGTAEQAHDVLTAVNETGEEMLGEAYTSQDDDIASMSEDASADVSACLDVIDTEEVLG